MKFTVITLFPNVVKEYINTSIVSRAIEKKLVEIDIVDLKDFGKGTRRNTDDTVYGGGDGMIITVKAIDKALEYVIRNNIKINDKNNSNNKEDCNKKTRIIYLSPKGKVLNQSIVKSFAEEESKENGEEHIVLIAGHYEGIDERIFKLYNIEELSIGDYVLTGGEIPAMVLIDSVTRCIPGVIKEDSKENESFEDYLLEESQYTKPEQYKGLKVPEILLSGNHQKIADYRLKDKIYTTYKKRKDLLEKYIEKENTNKEKILKIIEEKEEQENGSN